MAVAVRIVTPSGVAWEGEVQEMSASGYVGEFGVLPMHDRFLTVAMPGRVQLRTESEELRFVVGNGFVEVDDDQVTMLTDLFEQAGAVSAEQAGADLKEAEAALTGLAAGTVEWDEAQRKAQLSRARLG